MPPSYLVVKYCIRKITHIPVTTLKTVYNTAISTCPFLIKSDVSSENVENVVKPPHTPVFKNNTSPGAIWNLFKTKAVMQPIKIHPAILIKNVFTGNSIVSFTGTRPIKYLKTAPAKPPVPTKKHLYIILPISSLYFHAVFFMYAFFNFAIYCFINPYNNPDKK